MWWWSRKVGWVVGLCVVSCASPPTPVRIGGLLDETRANHIAVMAKYRGQTLAFDGVVLGQGTRRVEKVEAEHTPAFGYGSTSEVRRTPVFHPFLYVGDASGRQDGAVVCYFPPDQLSDVSRLTPGTRVSLRGTFQEPSRSPQGLDLIVNDCERL